MKRLLDVVLSSIGILLLGPLMVAVGCVIKVSMGSPVLFVQERAGLGGRSFNIIKFRTMRSQIDSDGRENPDDQRLTKLGRILRSTSVDELPELINVLRGDMSLVGPRPLLPEYIPLYSQRQSQRHDVLPGLTGWAQIKGRNAVSWEEKFELDVWYVENRSLALDLKILSQTVRAVLRRDGISAEGTETAHRFTGSLQ